MQAHAHPSIVSGISKRSIQFNNHSSADRRSPSINTTVSPSIDIHFKTRSKFFNKKQMSMDNGFLMPDEFGIFRDPDGHARAMDGRILHITKDDIEDILHMANGPENLFMQQRRNPDSIPKDPTNILQLIQRKLVSTNLPDRFLSHRSMSLDQRHSTGQHPHRSTGHILCRPINT
ncbi:hypothetical protein Bca4012_065259 [Brassica carinata]